MNFHKVLPIFLLFISLNIFCQTESRLATIKNNLEILKVDNPGLEEKVNVNITNTSLPNLLLAVSKVHNININVSPQLEPINIINNFSEVTISNLLLFLAKEYNLDINFTGNIISITPYKPEIPEPIEKEIAAQYDPQGNLISMDLRNDPLAKVFRKITDISGKNLVFAPDMENIPLSAYISKVPFESAIDKLALSNNLTVTQSRDGFFIFNRQYPKDSTNGVNKAIGIKDNFYYQVLDSIHSIVKVDFKNAPAADIIYSIAADLGLDVFTASPLTKMGSVTVKADAISFDTLLDKIFESTSRENAQKKNTSGIINQNRVSAVNLNDSPEQASNFTYKKEDGIYFFGTEDQLTLKEVVTIQMMHRSIEMLSNPSGNTNRTRNNRNFASGTTSYYGGTNNQNYNPANPNIADRRTDEKEKIDTEAIEKIIPDDLKVGLNIQIDSELNSFIVSGPSARIDRFRNFITYIDKPVPVILIEVMILEVNKTATVETGVSFGLGDKEVPTQGKVFPSADITLGAQTVNRIIGGFSGFGSLNIGKVLPNFYMDIKAMESNGNLKILSTPKLSTLNGHKAHLSSGQTTYYAVTNQNFYGSQIPQTSQITNYYPIDAELALDIMPFVAGDGEITLDINVIQSSFNGERIAENAPPGMNSREFSSIIRMRDQDVAILGGIEERTKDDSGTGVPLLARIPVLKWLFSQRKREDSKKKLNILIKPTIIY